MLVYLIHLVSSRASIPKRAISSTAWGGRVGRRPNHQIMLCSELNNINTYSTPLIPLSISFCLLLKIILKHPYLKILDLANLFVANAPMKKNQEIYFYPLSEHFEI